MALRAWALKPSELKNLDSSARVLFLTRCALRVEPWVPPTARAMFRAGLDLLLTGGPKPRLRQHARRLAELGAVACNRLESRDEPLGRCQLYATLVLSEALVALAEAAPHDATRSLLLAAKYAGSIPATLAHAGRVKAPKGKSPVDVAAGAIWKAMRDDVAWLGEEVALRKAKRPLPTLRKRPLWKPLPKWLP